MSRYEDEEEDELQMILEGRDVEEYRDYYENIKEDHQSEHSKSNRELDVSDEDNEDFEDKQKSKSQKIGESFKRREKTKIKPKPSSSSNYSEIGSDLMDETYGHNSRQLNPIPSEPQTNEIIKPKVRRTLKPRVLLNAQKLTSSHGIAVLPQIFSDFKFGPKGSEHKDLNAILFRLSHWSHRLFPSLTFDDFIEKCEQLGKKRAVKTFVTKIRNDLPLNLDPNETQPEDEETQHNDSDQDFDKDFDYIIANSYQNITENNETQELRAKDSHLEDLTVDDNLYDEQSTTSGSPLQSKINENTENQELQTIDTNFEEMVVQNNDNEEQPPNSELLLQTNVSEVDKQITDDSNDEELSEEQILKEINSDENTTEAIE